MEALIHVSVIVTFKKDIHLSSFMKCPKCKTEGFSLVHFEKGSQGTYYRKEKAILQCKKCKHKEVFG